MGLNKRLIGAGATASGALTPSENFKAVIYTGNGGTQAITGVGFKPDFVWLKCRSTSHSHFAADSTRGATKYVMPNETSAELTRSDQIQSFDTDGFTLAGNSDVNGSSKTYVAWCWKADGGTTSSNTDGSVTSTVQANEAAGFSIVTATAPSSGAFTVGHGLNAEIDLYITKSLSTAGWVTYVRDLGADKYLILNSSDAAGTSTNFWDNTNPTSSVFSMKAGYTIVGTANFVAYCFKSIDGFSKIGSYTGNSSNNGPIIETGFEPAFLMIKNASDAGSWFMYDNKRNTSNPRINYVLANAGNVEASDMGGVDFLSNGFQIKEDHDDVNDTGDTYIYMAFAADPDTEAPTLASSFNIETYTGTGSTQSISGLGFSPSLTWIKGRTNTASHQIFDTIRGATFQISSDTSGAETQNTSMLTAFDSDGVTLGGQSSVNGSGVNYVAWNWKADDNEPTLFGGPAAAVYKFEDNYNDVTGTYNGSGTSGTSFISGGKFNKAVAFSGTSSNMDTGITAGNFESWSFWFKPGSSNTGYRVLVSTNTSGDVGQNFEYSSSNSFYIVDILGGATNNSASVTIDLRDGNWHHVVLTKTATKFTAYLDKQEKISVTNATGSSLQKGNEWSFGKGNYGDANSDFKVDQARYFKSVLEQEDIDKLYAETEPDNDDLSFGAPKETIISANANAGFSIVKYTGTYPTHQKIPHGLSAVPNMILIKNLADSADWEVYHSATGNTGNLVLNSSAAFATNSGFMADTSPTATVFTVGNDGYVNGADDEHIAYCFHDVTGYQKFGTINGNGSTQNITGLGFQPDFVMIKGATVAESWNMYDSFRGATKLVRPNTSEAESTYTDSVTSFDSDGFTLGANTYVNQSGKSYIYMAIAKNVPSNTTLANSFKAVTYTGTGAGQKVEGIGFKPDLVWIKSRSTTNTHQLHDTVRGIGQTLKSSDSAAEVNEFQYFTGVGDGFLQFGTNAGNYNNTGTNYVAWAWKAGNTWQSNIDGTMPTTVNANTANGFSIVKYTGQGGVKTAGHGLSSAPEMIIVKSLGHSANWYTYHIGLDASSPEDYNVRLDQTDARQDSASYWDDTAPTSSVFTIGTTTGVSKSGTDFIAYCFHSVSGYSKISSYVGNAGTQTITTGFQPDFILIKKSSGTGTWRMFDSVRGTDKSLRANDSAAEYDDTQDYITFISTGFSYTNQSNSDLNENNSTYIYMAVKMN